MKAVCKNWAIGQLNNLPGRTRALVVAPIAVELQDIAATFVDLQEARHAADYDLSQSFTRADALTLIARTRRAFDDWSNVRGSSNASIFLAALLFEKQWKTR